MSFAGKEFKPISAQQFHAAAAQLYVGSTPAQLASLELVLQAHFSAPSFSALGHGPSFLQACSEDEVIMQTVSAAAATVPLNKVTAQHFTSCCWQLLAPLLLRHLDKEFEDSLIPLRLLPLYGTCICIIDY